MFALLLASLMDLDPFFSDDESGEGEGVGEGGDEAESSLRVRSGQLFDTASLDGDDGDDDDGSGCRSGGGGRRSGRKGAGRGGKGRGGSGDSERGLGLGAGASPRPPSSLPPSSSSSSSSSIAGWDSRAEYQQAMRLAQPFLPQPSLTLALVPGATAANARANEGTARGGSSRGAGAGAGSGACAGSGGGAGSASIAAGGAGSSDSVPFLVPVKPRDVEQHWAQAIADACQCPELTVTTRSDTTVATGTGSTPARAPRRTRPHPHRHHQGMSQGDGVTLFYLHPNLYPLIYPPLLFYPPLPFNLPYLTLLITLPYHIQCSPSFSLLPLPYPILTIPPIYSESQRPCPLAHSSGGPLDALPVKPVRRPVFGGGVWSLVVVHDSIRNIC